MPVAAEPLSDEVLDEIEEQTPKLEELGALELIEWGDARFGRRMFVSSSFQDCVLIDLATRVVPEIEVVFLDTRYHFDETISYLDEVRERYQLRVRKLTPRGERDDLWRTDVEGCCRKCKVEPLRRMFDVHGAVAWMTGLRRSEDPGRASAAPVEVDRDRRIVKINPIVAWSDEDVATYEVEQGLPVHPLRTQGYLSIGCWPCTQPVQPGESARAGRWAGTSKTECGIHLK